MQLLGRIFGSLFSPLASFTEHVAPVFAVIARRASADGDFTLAAIIVSAGTITILCGFWAAAEHIRFAELRRRSRADAARAQSAHLFRDALIVAGGQPLVVMGADLTTPMSFAGGHELLQSCLSGKDASALSAALDALLAKGAGFERTALTPDHRTVAVRGVTVGGRVAVYFREERKIGGLDLDGRSVLDALPLPVWVRNKELALRWVNRAFVNATPGTTFERALKAGIAFDRTELELAAAARDQGMPIQAKRYAEVGEERRALTLMLQPLDGVGVACAAVDVTDVAQSEIKLQTHIDDLHGVLDSFETAVAVFGPDHRLDTFNRAFAELWELPERWLDSQPTHDEILDRLRQGRRLPEQRDFAAWKRGLAELFNTLSGPVESLLHLPGGKSLRIRIAKNAAGCLTVHFHDVSDRLKQESAYNMLSQVQKAMLDTLEDGVAIIGPDGRINVYNSAFARLWRLTDEDLVERPHIRRIADICAVRIGRDHTWEIVASGVAAAEPERLNDWGKIGRADGRAISLALARLPDGGTLATFADLTDAMRFEVEMHPHETVAA